MLLRKARSYGEVYNDLDDEVVNVFRVLRDAAKAAELQRLVALTPFSRIDFKASYLPATSDVDGAHKTIIRSFMGFGSASMTRMHITGFRSNASRCGSTPAQDWSTWPRQISTFVERLRGVVIENKDGLTVMSQHDSPSTLHYVDPPYVQATRSSLRNKNGNRGHYYRHDMSDADHEQLLAGLRKLTGMVLLSGYASDLYQEALAGWTSFTKTHMADGARKRTEMPWLNPACANAQRQTELVA